jgi:uncharacterized protein YoxC
MGLISFLKEAGYIEDKNAAPKAQPNGAPPKEAATKASPSSSTFLTTTVFSNSGAVNTSAETLAPSREPKEAFIKFFEDAMKEANLPGEDYYEFRVQLSKMRERMGSRTSEDALLESVLINFEAKNVFPKDLIGHAEHYLKALAAKKDAFVKEAEAEKIKIRQDREAQVNKTLSDIESKKQRMQQLSKEIENLQLSIDQQNNSVEVTKSSIEEAVQKITNSQEELGIAHSYMSSNISSEINMLSSKQTAQ